MKIGIISIGNSSMELFRFLQRHDHDYHVYNDAVARPLGEKSFETGIAIIEKGIKYLQNIDVDYLILPPLFELHFLSTNDRVLPLYARYLQDAVFPHSLIGKLGILSDPSMIISSQALIDKEGIKHILTPPQQATKKFHSPMKYRVKDVRMRGLLLRSLSPREFLVNKIVKFDLHYLRDANVDTIIPTTYSHFAMEKTIQRFFNQKRQKFHGMEAVESAFVAVSTENNVTTSNYGVTVHCLGRQAMLGEKKRYMWMLQRGQQVEVSFVAVK